ncbi:MAG: hypothetical protein E7678_07950 [Ruminococcaceae bacterium]|nr:hypothetical protein [Oscillospiraceae bacterium]
MKKITKALVLIFALLLVFSSFVACDNNESNNGNNDGGKQNSKSVEFYINYKGTKIELDKKADSVLSSLGEPKSTASLGDCGGFGTQIKYVYDDIVIYTVKNDSGESIDQIAFSNDIVETEKGICIGDSADDVISAYGEPTTKNANKIEYESGSLILKFGLNGDSVKSIDFIRIINTNN